MTDEEARAVSSLIGSRQAQLVKSGMSRAVARKQAIAEIGPDLASEAHRYFGRMGGRKSKRAETAPKSQVADPRTETTSVPDHTYTILHWWVVEEEVDTLPAAKFIARALNVTPQTVYNARNRLEREGFGFETLNGRGTGYKVTKRPAPPPPPVAPPPPPSLDEELIAEIVKAAVLAALQATDRQK
jgi:DNA-binding transcriptional regulator YhcF (GntR family)